jgi:aspartate-semialdehyde dehydrogenase
MSPTGARRIVIAGAASLRGKEVADTLGNGTLAAADVRLLDEEIAAPILAAAAGEATVVLPVAEDSFEGADLVIFAGSPAFAQANVERALSAGAQVIDIGGALSAHPGATTSIPALDDLLPTRIADRSSGKNAERVFISPGSASIVCSFMAVAFSEWPSARISIVMLRPVSERGSAAVEELESQTIKLLSFQPLPQMIFAGQVAFNLIDRYGPESSERLADVSDETERTIRGYLDGHAPLPAVQIIQAPVFYGYTFTAYIEFESAPDMGAVETRLAAAGFHMRPDDDAPSNVAAAGEPKPLLARPHVDANRPNGIWLWGAADNIRLAAANAVAIAEKVLSE